MDNFFEKSSNMVTPIQSVNPKYVNEWFQEDKNIPTTIKDSFESIIVFNRIDTYNKEGDHELVSHLQNTTEDVQSYQIKDVYDEFYDMYIILH